MGFLKTLLIDKRKDTAAALIIRKNPVNRTVDVVLKRAWRNLFANSGDFHVHNLFFYNKKSEKTGELIPADFSFNHLKICQPFFEWRVGGEEFHNGVSGQGWNDEERVCALNFCFCLNRNNFHPPADFV